MLMTSKLLDAIEHDKLTSEGVTLNGERDLLLKNKEIIQIK